MEILDTILPDVGEYPQPVELTVADVSRPNLKAVRVLSPKLLKNMAYYLMHSVIPTKSTKLPLEMNIQYRSEIC